MKQFNTVVLERMAFLNSPFTTEAYECGWASEALFFIRLHEMASGAKLQAKVEISVDGIVWVPEGSAFPELTICGDYFCRVSHFGGWLRLNGQIRGGAYNSVKATISLVLKE